MDSRVTLVGLSFLVVALAGCSGGGDDGPSVEEQCGLDDKLWTGSECIFHTEPSIMVSGLDDSVQAHLKHAFTWKLDNGTRGGDEVVHSMDSRIMATTSGDLPTNMTEPDAFGTEIAVEAHKDLPGEFEGEFSWPEAGASVKLWGYMLIDAKHVWNPITTVNVVSVEPNGDIRTITISGTPPAADQTSTQFLVGTGLNFQNDLPAPTVMSYTVSFTCSNGVTIAPVTVDAGATSSTIDFLEPTRCDWVANSQGAATGSDPFSIEGAVIVSAA